MNHQGSQDACSFDVTNQLESDHTIVLQVDGTHMTILPGLQDFVPAFQAYRHDGQSKMLQAIHPVCAFVGGFDACQVQTDDPPLLDSVGKDGMHKGLACQPVGRFDGIACCVNVCYIGA